MVEPVMVVRDVVGAALALHAEQIRLTRIPVVVVADGDELRVALQVGSTVALGMVATAVRAIELIRMVNPDVAVVGIERDAVVHATHDGEVAELHTLAITYQETETVHGSIVANALEGHVHWTISFLTFYLQALFRAADFVEVVLGNQSDETEGNRRGVVTLLIGINNGLNACTGGDIGILGTCLDGGGNGLGSILRHIKHLGTILQRTVAVVSTRGIPIHKSKALATVVKHFQLGGRGFLRSDFRASSIHGYYFYRVRARLQAYHIGTSIATVVAHQFVVNLGKVSVLSTLYIDVIGLSTVHRRELHVGRLQPATGLDDLNTGTGKQRQTRKHS